LAKLTASKATVDVALAPTAWIIDARTGPGFLVWFAGKGRGRDCLPTNETINQPQSSCSGPDVFFVCMKAAAAAKGSGFLVRFAQFYSFNDVGKSAYDRLGAVK
jgi:hypothetical protein